MGQAGRTAILVDPPLAGSTNMTIDQDMLQCAEASEYPVTLLRLYSWEEPTVSIGYHQGVEDSFNWEYCRARGIPVVRRPTGGRAVLHADELTYSVVSNDPGQYPIGSLDHTYLAIAKCLQMGFSMLGIATELAVGSRDTEVELKGAGKPPCFASASRHELLCEGRKLAGSAQRRLKRSFLQHGSIPLSLDATLMAAALGVNQDLILRTTISLSEAAGREVVFRELAEALRAAFSQAWATTT